MHQKHFVVLAQQEDIPNQCPDKQVLRAIQVLQASDWLIEGDEPNRLVALCLHIEEVEIPFHVPNCQSSFLLAQLWF